MKRYLYAAFFGLCSFAAQIGLAAQLQLSALDGKSEALALRAFGFGTTSAELVATIAWYLLLGALVHIIPMLATAKVHTDLARLAQPRIRTALSRRGMLTLLLLMTLLLLALCNYWLLPSSMAFPNIDLIFAQAGSPLLVYGLPVFLCALGFYWFVAAASRCARITVAAISLIMLAGWSLPWGGSKQTSNGRMQPDVIVIGIDSLRPDHLNIYGFPDQSPVPTVDAFVRTAHRFDQAYTTQGRTFVAYMSIFSGQYPIRNGVRENLYPAERYHKDELVAHRFAADGYTTMLAMDEARFANFDSDFGFQSVIGPPPGAADFLIATFFDTVGTNLLQLLPYADKLMPHVAGNRAAASTYRPANFDAKVARAVHAADPERPLFLISHYCVAHVPFVTAPTSAVMPAVPYEDSPRNYRAALTVADGQVSNLLSQLKHAGRLDNAIVVMLSDHGESLGMAKDLWRNPGGGRSFIGFIRGHGSLALDDAESRVLFSIQRFIDGKPILPPSSTSAPVSLIDIAPTLLSLSGIAYPSSFFDGRALLTRDNELAPMHERALFIESGISGTSLQANQVDPNQVATEFSYLYRITPSLRFELEPRELPEQLRRKQRAIMLGRYGLSSWPAGARPQQVGSWIKLDRRTRIAEELPFDTIDPVVQTYRPLLCSHFHADTQFRQAWCTGVEPLNGSPENRKPPNRVDIGLPTSKINTTPL